MAEKTMFKCWLSHSVAPSNEYQGYGDKLAISIVLDRELAGLFAGVRFIVVTRDVPSSYAPLKLKHLQLLDVILPEDGADECHDPRPDRRILERTRAFRQSSAELLADLNSTALALWVVIFEVQGDNFRIFTPPSVNASKPEYRIVFEAAKLFDPRHSSVSLILRYVYTPSESLSFDFLSLNHQIHILPVARRRALPSLPLSALRIVAAFCLAQCSYDAARSLLALALTQKAWLPVLDVFFELIGRPFSIARFAPRLASVVRSLKLNPSRGHLIGGIYIPNFSYFSDPSSMVEFFDALATLVDLLPHVKVVEIPELHEDFGARILNGLSRLRAIERFIVFPPPAGSLVNPMIYPTFLLKSRMIMALISHWPNLECLSLLGVEFDDTEDHQPTSKELVTASRLGVLYLTEGFVTGPSLLRFCSSSPPTLQAVKLSNLSQPLPNKDLYSFLMQVAPTIVYLALCGVVFSVHEDKDEEHALDAAIPCLTKLRYLKADASMLSLLSLTRVADVELEDIELPALPFSDVFPLHERRTIILNNPLRIMNDDFVEALRITGWRRIWIIDHAVGFGNSDYDGILRKAAFVAKQRDIRLRWSFVSDLFISF